MTDARLPERWIMDRRVLLTSPQAWRLYTFGLMYAVTNRSDGLLAADDLALIPAVDPKYAAELMQLGLWEDFGQGAILITDFKSSQSSRDELDQLERIRAADREKKRRKRLSPGQSPGPSPGTAQAGRLGRQERPGSPKTEGQGLSPAGANRPVSEAGGTDPDSAAIPENRRDHDGPEPVVHDDQHDSGDGSADASVQTVTRASGDGQDKAELARQRRIKKFVRDNPGIVTATR